MAKNNFYIVDIEPLDTRYTKQWRTWLPEIAKKHFGDTWNIINIEGNANNYTKPQPGAFFDFFGTCSYKASQAVKIAEMFANKEVKNGDYFFFADAWNQTVHYIKYMSELSNIRVRMGGIWHAGWYDPTDILGVTFKNKDWAFSFERSLYHALDQNFYGTYHNRDLFLKTLDLENFEKNAQKCISPGVYPLEWISNLTNTNPKDNIVVFPHRLNYDKAPWIFDSLKENVQKTHPHIKFIKTQEQNFSKEEYYEFLKKCKVIFSANRHENLGIGTFEAISSGCIPLVPNKLSYKEIYKDPFLYDVDENFYENFSEYLTPLSNKIIDFVENYNTYKPMINSMTAEIQEKFFSGTNMFNHIKSFINNK
jgi:glycosyltransferase involved in cell wall biosynthesis